MNQRGIEISQYCKPHKLYISLVVPYLADVAKYFKNKHLMMNQGEDIIENALVIDNMNSRGLFAQEYATVLGQFKHLRCEMTEGLERATRCQDLVLLAILGPFFIRLQQRKVIRVNTM